MSELKSMTVTCPACDQDVELPARLVLSSNYTEDGQAHAQILLSLDKAREHTKTCTSDSIFLTALEAVGLPY